MQMHRLILLLSVMLLSACEQAPDDSNLYRLTDEFGVCIRLPKGATYQYRSEGIDFDFGDAVVNGKKVSVYIGMQPDYDTGPWDGKQDRSKGWMFLGKRHVDGKDKIIWGYRRQMNRGPLFVLFEGANLGPVERELTAKHLLVDCLPSNW